MIKKCAKPRNVHKQRFPAHVPAFAQIYVVNNKNDETSLNKNGTVNKLLTQNITNIQTPMFAACHAVVGGRGGMGLLKSHVHTHDQCVVKQCSSGNAP